MSAFDLSCVASDANIARLLHDIWNNLPLAVSVVRPEEGKNKTVVVPSICIPPWAVRVGSYQSWRARPHEVAHLGSLITSTRTDGINTLEMKLQLNIFWVEREETPTKSGTSSWEEFFEINAAQDPHIDMGGSMQPSPRRRLEMMRPTPFLRPMHKLSCTCFKETPQAKSNMRQSLSVS